MSKNPIKTFLKKELKEFLLTKDLLQLILAVYLGEVLKSFFEAFVDDLLVPLIKELFPKNKNDVGAFEITIRGIKFEIGQLLVQTLSLFVAFFIAYLFTKGLFKIIS